MRSFRGVRTNRRGPLLILAILVGIMGCGQANRQALEKKVLEADPSFRAVLDKHEELTNRLETHQRELALKRDSIQQTIKRLRRDLTIASKRVREKKAQTRTLMNPDRERLRLSLTMAGEDLRTARQRAASLRRSANSLRQSLEKGNEAWTGEERLAQQANLTQMEQDLERVTQEAAGLEAHVRLLKIKLLLTKISPCHPGRTVADSDTVC